MRIFNQRVHFSGKLSVESTRPCNWIIEGNDLGGLVGMIGIFLLGSTIFHRKKNKKSTETRHITDLSQKLDDFNFLEFLMLVLKETKGTLGMTSPACEWIQWSWKSPLESKGQGGLVGVEPVFIWGMEFYFDLCPVLPSDLFWGF